MRPHRAREPIHARACTSAAQPPLRYLHLHIGYDIELGLFLKSQHLIDRPIPRPPPVTIATLPCKLGIDGAIGI
jgi:hypothetical protein